MPFASVSSVADDTPDAPAAPAKKVIPPGSVARSVSPGVRGILGVGADDMKGSSDALGKYNAAADDVVKQAADAGKEIKDIAKTIDWSRPAVPTLVKPEEEKPVKQRDPREAMFSMTTLLGMMVGALGGSAGASLKAASAAMEGVKEGNAAKVKEAHDAWLSHQEYIKDTNKWATDQFDLIMNDRKASMEDKMSQIAIVADNLKMPQLVASIREGQWGKAIDLMKFHHQVADDQARLLIEQKRLNIEETRAKAAASGGGLSDSAVETIAQEAAITGALPTGFTRNASMTAKIWNRVAEIKMGTATTPQEKAQALAYHKMAFTAAQSGLKSVETKLALSKPAEESAIKELEYVQRLADVLGRKSPSLLNRPLNTIAAETGDADVVALNSAVESAVGEVAKVISGSVGSSGATDSSRREARALIDSSMSVKQIAKAVEVAKQSMAYKVQALDDEKEEILSSVTGDATGASAGDASPAGGSDTGRDSGGKEIHYDAQGNRVK